MGKCEADKKQQFIHTLNVIYLKDVFLFFFGCCCFILKKNKKRSVEETLRLSTCINLMTIRWPQEERIASTKLDEAMKNRFGGYNIHTKTQPCYINSDD